MLSDRARTPRAPDCNRTRSEAGLATPPIKSAIPVLRCTAHNSPSGMLTNVSFRPARIAVNDRLPARSATKFPFATTAPPSANVRSVEATAPGERVPRSGIRPSQARRGRASMPTACSTALSPAITPKPTPGRTGIVSGRLPTKSSIARNTSNSPLISTYGTPSEQLAEPGPIVERRGDAGGPQLLGDAVQPIAVAPGEHDSMAAFQRDPGD